MGNNAASFNDEDDSQRRFRTAATTVGLLASHTGQANKDRKRAELKATLESMKREKAMTYMEMESEDNTDSSRFQHNTSSDSDSFRHRHNKHDKEACCHICEKLAQVDGHPCRTCDRIFHKHCLETSGQCRSIDLELLARADTNIGWSCYICSNLSLLLTEDEMNQIIETFDLYDTDKDSAVSWEEYEKHRSYLYSGDGDGPGIPGAESERLHLDFKLADVDGDGHLDWWEFVNHDAKIMLMKRRKADLVSLLTEKELQMARDMFSALDLNHDGKITEMEAREAFRQWYRNITSNSGTSSDFASRTSEDTYVTVSTRMIMHSDDAEHDVLTWPLFQKEQALYLICNRPNMVNAGSLWNQ